MSIITSQLFPSGNCEQADTLVCGQSIAIFGAPRTGKSSIAFECAIQHALKGQRVFVFCRHSLLVSQDKFPKPQTSLDRIGEPVLAFITFQYVDSLAGARAELAKLSTLTRPLGNGEEGCGKPSLFVVEDDGLEDALDKYSVNKTISLLQCTCDGFGSDAGFVYVCSQLKITPSPFTETGEAAATPLPFPFDRCALRCETFSAAAASTQDGSPPSFVALLTHAQRPSLFKNAFVVARFHFTAELLVVDAIESHKD